MSQVDFHRVFDLLSYQQTKYVQQKSLNQLDGDKWIHFSSQQIQERVNHLSAWLNKNNFQSGEKVALIPRMGSAYWMMADFACQQLGLILVPIHPTSSAEEISFILTETEVRLVLVADDELMKKVQSIKPQSSIFILENHVGDTWPALTYVASQEELKRVEEIKTNITAQHLLAILYTSGTSGEPKGAMLSHYNVVSNIKSILPILPLEAGYRALSFLPFSHIFERTSCYAYIAFGVNIYFSQQLQHVSRDFKSVRPYFCTTVPKTLERMYNILQQQAMGKSWWQRRVIAWAMAVGEKYRDEKRSSFFLGSKLFIARQLVLYRWRTALGGQMKYMAVGAAALRPEISRLFSAAGVITLAGYGMTEASPFISVNRPDFHKFGTVGLPVPGVEIKLEQMNEQGEGEILVRGPNIMQGYFKRAELTAQVITNDGWLRTGDVGKWAHKHFLVITDRKKDIFKTTSGIYIAPQPLESYFTTSPFIFQCLVFGFNKPFVSALIVPNFEILKNWCTQNNIHWTSPPYMVHNIKVVARIQMEVDRLNEALENYKRVKKFVLSDVEWTAEGGQLSASFKTMRAKLMEKYHSEIEKLYVK
ncbi:MAG: AMP-dependent synthetase/ligase [Cytophagales bacterium]